MATEAPTEERSEAPVADRSASRGPALLGALASLLIGSVIYSRFNLYSFLARDSAIYMYGGQRATHGVPPYASIMDPKGPIPGLLCGIGVAVARLFHRNDLLVVRVGYCALSIMAVLGIYLLVLELWHSVVAGVAAAAVFASFKMFAFDALTGPDGHTPGIVFLIFGLWLTVRRRWYWAGVASALAFCSWQPLFIYPAMALVCAAVWSQPGRRWRAVGWTVGGWATVYGGLSIYYAASGYSGKLFEGLIEFPLVGAFRLPTTVSDRLNAFFGGMSFWYGFSAVLLWVGLILLGVIAVWQLVTARSRWRSALTGPVWLLLIVSLVVQFGYIAYDYIGWPHVFPLLPYAACGFGGAVAYLQRAAARVPTARIVTGAAALGATVVLVAVCAVDYETPSNRTVLQSERAASCAMQTSLVPGTTLASIDQPAPLVLLHRVNPDNYPYVGSGLAEWKAKHTPGGVNAWLREIAGASSIVVFDNWAENIPIHRYMEKWFLDHGYQSGFIGWYHVYLTAGARQEMQTHGIWLAQRRRTWPRRVGGAIYRRTVCTSVSAG